MDYNMLEGKTVSELIKYLQEIEGHYSQSKNEKTRGGFIYE